MVTILTILQVIIRVIIIAIQVAAKVAVKAGTMAAKAGAKVAKAGAKVANSTAGKVAKQTVKTSTKVAIKGTKKVAKTAIKTTGKAAKTATKATKVTTRGAKGVAKAVNSDEPLLEKATQKGAQATVKGTMLATKATAKTAILSLKLVVVSYLKLLSWSLKLITSGLILLYLSIIIQAVACVAILAPVIVTVTEESEALASGGVTTTTPDTDTSTSVDTEGAELFSQGAYEIMEGLVKTSQPYVNSGTTTQAGETFRPDCSGYVTGCLNKFFKAIGSDSKIAWANTSAFAGDATVMKIMEDNGFVKYNAKDLQVEDLQKGDIICYTNQDSGRKYGHVCIYYTPTGKLDFGAARSTVLQKVAWERRGDVFAEVGSNYHAFYRVVWRYEGKK